MQVASGLLLQVPCPSLRYRSLRSSWATSAAGCSGRWRCCTSARGTGKVAGLGHLCSRTLTGLHEGVTSCAGWQDTGASGCLSFLSLSSSQLRNVLELIEFFEEEDRFYLVFEKMRGGGCWGQDIRKDLLGSNLEMGSGSKSPGGSPGGEEVAMGSGGSTEVT